MRNLLTNLLVCVVVVAISTSVASAQDKKKGEGKKGERPTAEQIFQKLDADGNGALTLAEFSKSRRYEGKAEEAKAAFVKIAGGEDKTVSSEQFVAAMKKAMEGKKGEGKKGGKKSE